MLKEYYSLMKTGLVFGNLITVIAGFLLASHTNTLNISLLFATLVGMFFVMASGCVFNNYIDRDIDALMERTEGRALVKGKVSGNKALIFGTVLGIIGFFTLGFFTNILTGLLAGAGYFFYVCMYSAWFKRKTAWGTFIGTLAGATPPLIGYAAASNHLDLGAAIIFALLVFWQMAHFFSIAIRRKNDYVAAKLPIFPIQKGSRAGKISVLLYIIGFTFTAPLLSVSGYLGITYLILSLVLGLVWLVLSVKGFWIDDEKKWARQMFFFSLVVMIGIFAEIAIESAL